MVDWELFDLLNAPETEEETLDLAVATLEHVADPTYYMWAEMKALADQLTAKTDELNRKIAHVEASLLEKGLRPGWVPMGLNAKGMPLFLCWTGEKLMVELCKDGKRLQFTPILNTSRECRVVSVKFLSKLYEAARVGQGVAG